jgi:hypothetical protein
MASAYLTRTTTNETATGRQKYTFSFWMKMAEDNYTVFGASNDGTYNNNYNIFDINSVGRIDFSGYETGTTFRIRTTRNLRDYSGWYHIVVSVDTTQATASNRIKIYINGTQETDLDSSVYPSQNHQGRFFASSKVMTVGGRSGAYFNGSLAHFYAIEGVAYDADTFGETDSTTGIWKPKLNPSVTYANNSFFLKFENTSDFGEDSSGNNNDLTVNGTVTQTIDTPSNVFATLNALYNSGGTATYANGNTNLAESDNQWKTTFSTLGASSGKYYAEFKSNGNWTMIGVADYNVTKSGIADRNFASTTFISEQGYGYYNGNGDLYYRGSSTTYGATYGNGDIVQVALDCDNNRVFFGKNGTWQNSADPTTPSTGFAMTATNATYVFAVAVQNNNLDCNFGNGYFGTTAVSSAGTNAGIGTFEYDVPSGYKALCTKNINAEEYS